MKSFICSKNARCTGKKIIGILLSVLMLLGTVAAVAPITASAADTATAVSYKKEGNQAYMQVPGDSVNTWHKIYIYNAEEILTAARAHTDGFLLTDYSTVDISGTKWFKASSATNTKYNINIGLDLGQLIAKNDVEEIGYEFNSVCNVTTDMTVAKYLRLDFRNSNFKTSYSNVLSDKRHIYTTTSPQSGAKDVLNITPDKDLSDSALSNGVQYLVLFPWWDASKKNRSGECEYSLKWLGVFSKDGLAAQFDIDEYAAQTIVPVSVSVKIDGVSVPLGTFNSGSRVNIPEPELEADEIFVGYIDSTGSYVSSVLANDEVKELSTVKRYKVDKAKYIYDTGRNGNLANLAKEDLTVAYLGGSVTYGRGSTSNKNGYAHQVTAQLVKMGKKVTPVYAGIGSTGSRLGAFRLQDHIIDRNPDLIFVEYAVNDSSYEERNGNTLYFEYILRTLRQELPESEIIVLFSTNSDYAAKGGAFGAHNDAETDSKRGVVKAQELVARHYGVVSINTGDYLLESMYGLNGDKIDCPTSTGEILSGSTPNTSTAKGKIWSYFFPDNVHPSDLGHQLYTELIMEYLKDIPADPDGADAHTVPMDVVNEKVKTFDARIVPLKGGEGVEIVGFNYGTRGTDEYNEMLTPNGQGTYSISFPFGGDCTQIALMMSSAVKEGDCVITVVIEDDSGTPVITKPATDLRHYNGYNNYRQHSFMFKETDLDRLDPDKTYTAKMTFQMSPIDPSAATLKYRSIYSIMIGGEKQDDGVLSPTGAIMLARAIAGWTGAEYDGITDNTSAFDFNKDGKVNSVDLVSLVRHLAGWKGYEDLLNN